MKRRDLREYMPFFGERFFAGTRLWEWSEVGLYMWAIWQQWRSGRAQVVSRDVFEALPERAREKFKPMKSGWRNRTCFETYRDSLRAYSEASERNSGNAKKGWKKRGASGIKVASDGMRLDANKNRTEQKRREGRGDAGKAGNGRPPAAKDRVEDREYNRLLLEVEKRLATLSDREGAFPDQVWTRVMRKHGEEWLKRGDWNLNYKRVDQACLADMLDALDVEIRGD